MKKKLISFILLLVLLSAALISPIPAEARHSSGYSYRPYYRQYKYTMPRDQIPVPKTEPIRPYFRKDGTYVQPHFRAPKGSLRPYYEPGYPKYKFRH